MTRSTAVTVNGALRPLAGFPVHTSLLDFLRGQGLTGAKEGCAEGECGACAVLVARPDGARSGWVALNACLVPAAAYDGQEVVTAEGIGGPERLHPVQREMAERGGSQCGYCTPGFVCSMAAEYYRPRRATAGSTDGVHSSTPFDVEALSGNLCRCTGYRPIRDAALALGAPDPADPLSSRLAAPAPAPAATLVSAPDGLFTRPTDLDEALTILADDPGATVVAGSTDWGVEVNLRGRRASSLVVVDRLDELREFELTDEAVTLGAALTLSELERLLAGRVPLLDEVWPQFASRLIRNGATLGGNLGTASPIGDTAPALLALEATLLLVSRRGEREVPLADFFTGYRRTLRERDELIRAARIPLPLSSVVCFHKVAKRRADDISSVAVALALDIGGGVVRRARIGLGGVAATPLRALATEGTLEGRPWTAETVLTAAEVLAAEGTPIDDVRASAAYRAAMLRNALLRLAVERGGLEVRLRAAGRSGGAT
ncbi:MAG TPA: FAD binding domain-containing protein [Ornithinibacter sp.]|nr:FAD binding domain-containing protein [Ornithinibacter sp.]